MEILRPATAVSSRPPEDNEHHQLFRGFPNSYGTLGYSLSLTIELEPVHAGAVVGPLGEAAADPAIGGEVEVRKDPDRLETGRRQHLEDRLVGQAAGRVVHRRLVEGDVGRIAAGDDRRERARRVRRLRPDAPEVGAVLGQRIEGRVEECPERPAVPGDPQSIAPEGVDGDDEDVSFHPLSRGLIGAGL